MWKEDLHVCFLDLAVIFFVDLDEFVLDRNLLHCLSKKAE